MPSPLIQDDIEKRLEAISNALGKDTLQNVQRMLNSLHPSEIAHLLESSPHTERQLMWKLVDAKIEGDVLVNVIDEVRIGLIQSMDTAELVAATENMDTDDLADILEDLPQAVIQGVLFSMDRQDRQRLVSVLSYPEDSAGGLMNTDTITIRPDVSIDVVLRYLRMRGELPEFTDNLIVVDRNDAILGLLPISALLTKDPSFTIEQVMITKYDTATVDMHENDVANLFEHRDLISIPVIDMHSRLVGRITIDDVVDVIRDEAELSVRNLAGLDEEDDMFAPVITSTRRRAIWLGVNLMTAFLASWVIGLFEATLERVVALAVLMPIVASMGGVAGGQTLTLIIRGIALGHVRNDNSRWLLSKEVAIGVLNGFLWAIVVSIVVSFWYGDYQLSLLIAVAMIINLIVAAFAGVGIPILLHKLGLQPALAGPVVMTTITDVIGFFTFLGLASIFMMG